MFKIQVLSNRKAGSSLNSIVANGRYALVAMTVRSAEIDNKTIEFYVPLLAQLDANNNVTGVVSMQKDDLRTRPIAKLAFDGNGKVELRNNSGSLIEAVDKRYSDHAGLNLDIVWFKHILGELRGKVFDLKADMFQSRSRKGNLYTTAVYGANLIEGQTLNLANNDVRKTIATTAASFGIQSDKIFALDPGEDIEFVDDQGNTVQ